MNWFSWLMLGMLIGVIAGQLSVWRHLRKKHKTVIDGWVYSAYKNAALYTCAECSNQKDCPAIWDDYNVDGYCIMEK